MLYAGAALSMPFPRLISDDSVVPKYRCDELGDSAIATVREDASMEATQAFYLRAAVVDRIVAVARTSTCDGDHAEIPMTDKHLGVARPAIVLRLGGGLMVARGNEGAVDDPAPPTIRVDRGREEPSDPWHEIRDDAMNLGFGDRIHRSQLAHREVGAKARAHHP
ncbi:MAG TPA: hypothetical protein VLB44_00965 [Kofleriaceae bacterium]|nr:hypothetical protein [Kofleriaceae bacterium]